MSNKPRICLPNRTYHANSRCLQALGLMKRNSYKDKFLEIIEEAQEKYEFELNAFAILHNHFHLIIKTLNEKDTISRIMQYVKSRFALWYNRTHNRIGPFWNERFRDKIIEHSSHSEFYLNWLIWYLAYNPVKKGYTEEPWNYQHSSINFYLGKKCKMSHLITPHEFFLKLGSTHKERLKRLMWYGDFYREVLELKMKL